LQHANLVTEGDDLKLQGLLKPDDPGVMDLDAGISDRTDGDGQDQWLQ
jgi:hypothetical protein